MSLPESVVEPPSVAAPRRRRWRWVPTGCVLLIAFGVLAWWLVPRSISAHRASAQERLAQRLEAMELDLDGEGGELGACLLRLGETQRTPGDSTVGELREDTTPEWACPGATFMEWPLFAPSVPLRRCAGASRARWARDAEPLHELRRELLRQLDLALREPDPNERLYAVRAAVEMMTGYLTVAGSFGYTPFVGAIRRAITWLGAGDEGLRRELAADLRRWASELPDERFVLASHGYRDSALWHPVDWADAPFMHRRARLAAVEGPVGRLGDRRQPAPRFSELYNAFDDLGMDRLWLQSGRYATDLLVAAALLDGGEVELEVFEQAWVIEEREGRRCARGPMEQPECVRPEWENARRIAMDRAIQTFARETFPGDVPDSIVRRIPPLPAGPLTVPVAVDTRRLPPRAAGGRSRVEVRLRTEVAGERTECSLVVGGTGEQGLLRMYDRSEEPAWETGGSEDESGPP